MKRLLAALSLTMLVATLAVVMPAAPASANGPHDLCAGIGSASTVALTYPGLSAAASGSFSFNLDTGACVFKASLQASGTVTGWCGLSSGWGSTSSGHALHFVGLGGVLLVTGQVNGAVAAVPDVTTGQSCTTGATRFIVAGGAVLIRCGAGVSFDLTTAPPTFNGAVYASCP